MEILATYVSAISKRKRLNNEEIDKVLLNGFNVMWRHNTLSIKHNPNFWAISTKYKEIEKEINDYINNFNNDDSR